MAAKPTCIHHSPERKIALRQELYDIVYERTVSVFEETLTEIRQKNIALMSHAWDGFTHAGVYYGVPFPKIERPTHKKDAEDRLIPVTRIEAMQYVSREHQRQVRQRNQRLHDTLVPAMELLVAEREKVERVEGVLVTSALGSVLKIAKHIEDYKRLLPQLLHNHLDQVATECECDAPRLSDEEIAAVLAKHGPYINKIRQRQLLYLLQP